MTPTNHVSDSRKAFEKWAASQGYSTTKLGTLEDPCYASQNTGIAWMVWQAALSTMGDVVAVGELKSLVDTWTSKADEFESRGLGKEYGELGTIRTGLVSAYNTACDDLSAILNRGGK